METDIIKSHRDRMLHNVASTSDILQIMDNKLLSLFDELCTKDELLREAEENSTSNGCLLPDGVEVSKSDIKTMRTSIRNDIIELKDSIAKGAGKTPQTNIQINQSPNETLLSLLKSTTDTDNTTVPRETQSPLDIPLDEVGVRGANDIIDTLIGDKQSDE